MSSRAQVEVGRGGDFPKTTLKKGSHQTSLRPRSDRGRRCEVYFTDPFGDDDALTSHWSINSRRVGRFSHHARQCENFLLILRKRCETQTHHEIAGPSDNFRIRKSDHPNKRVRNNVSGLFPLLPRRTCPAPAPAARRPRVASAGTRRTWSWPRAGRHDADGA